MSSLKSGDDKWTGAPDRPELRSAVRRFLDDHVAEEDVSRWESDHGTPRSLIAHLADLGLCALAIPEEFGGAGRQIISTLVVVEELARRSHSLAGMYWAHTAYAGFTLSEVGSDEQKRRFLPEAAKGQVLFAYGLSEPNVGADLASVETSASMRGDLVVVDGVKRWISMADIADYIYALVRTGPAEDRRKNLTFVLVPTSSRGVTIRPLSTMGDQGVTHCEVEFDHVEVDANLVVGGDAAWNRGWDLLTSSALEVEKLGVPAMALGIAEAAVEEAWTFSQERRQFGRRICGHQAIRHALAEAQTNLLACRLMVYSVAELVENRLPSASATSMAKLFVTETAKSIVLSCQQVMGAHGYASAQPMQRHVRDILALPIVGGSSAIQRNNISSLLGLPRD